MNSTPSSGVKEVLMLHHSHLDVGYSHPQPIVWEIQGEHIDQAIDWLERTADLPEGVRPKWTCEATEPVRRWLARASASKRNRFVKLCKEGRIGLAALRWHTAALIDRPALQRLVDGKNELEQLIGAPIRVACQHDVNGVPWPMADVLLDAGVDLFVMAINIHFGRPVALRPGMFLWEAPSGRSLRVFNGHHYTMFDQNMQTWHDSVDRMAEGWSALSRRLDAIDYKLDFVYLTSTCAPVLWDNTPPNPFTPELLQRWNAAEAGPPVRYVTFDDLRERALALPEADLPTLRGDWTDYWSFGYGSTPIATALNQQSKPLISAAEALAVGREHSTLQRARDNVDMFDEHTWGYYITQPDHPQARTTELLKQAHAHEGHELAAFAVMDGLERLAQNPVADTGIKGVLICNPSPYPVTVQPRLPASWFSQTGVPVERTYRTGRLFYDYQSWGRDYPGADPVAFGPLELEPFAWRSIPLAELPAPSPTPLVSHTIETSHVERRELNVLSAMSHLREIGRLESPFHILRYEVANGRIISLVDRRQDRELLAPGKGLDFFAFVRERPDALVDGSRYALYTADLEEEKFDNAGWQDWEPIRERATRVTDCSVRVSAGRVTLERSVQAPGMTHLVQRITLLEHDPVIHLEAEFEVAQETSPQGFYLAFPLAMSAGWEAMFDTAGQHVHLDEDQLPGACRNWVTAESVGAIWNQEGAVALLTPDAPMIQFGDFHFGPPLDAVPRDDNPLLLAWPVNNYWGTNFPQVQPGRTTLRYGFLSMPEMDEDVIRRHSAGMRLSPLLWPITHGGRDAGEGVLAS
ncbi:hypothetical protein [Streptomyces sp. NBC_00154]|uniref:glycoside hydrolase family 38 N-terminal domain-containing protein n=1 Tax=Streptomyces sp. NBC_00154 TaxID=2975670 RepID=UPI0022569E64|nr:hypothetical protein [Streptomyces sp. NBC_00154]MCX5317028.1 hypothetical protein [Streptomyces sp. NBC_00154]